VTTITYECAAHPLAGMRWTVRGAGAIISLRCADASGRWDEVWQRLHFQTTAA